MGDLDVCSTHAAHAPAKLAGSGTGDPAQLLPRIAHDRGDAVLWLGRATQARASGGSPAGPASLILEMSSSIRRAGLPFELSGEGPGGLPRPARVGEQLRAPTRAVSRGPAARHRPPARPRTRRRCRPRRDGFASRHHGTRHEWPPGPRLVRLQARHRDHVERALRAKITTGLAGRGGRVGGEAAQSAARSHSRAGARGSARRCERALWSVDTCRFLASQANAWRIYERRRGTLANGMTYTRPRRTGPDRRATPACASSSVSARAPRHGWSAAIGPRSGRPPTRLTGHPPTVLIRAGESAHP